MKKNPFEILGCRENMTIEEIKKKYKSLAFKYHPDRNTNLDEKDKKISEEKFKEVACAYSFLEKNNFKYTPLDSNFEEFTSRFGVFSARFGKIGNIINNIRNMDLDNIANNILKEVNHIQDIYNGENESLEKSSDININARVELIDIYNNVKKTITINCVKKCKTCMGLGYNINDKTKCEDCVGRKIRLENLELSFYPSLKSKQLLRDGNEELGKRPGDININIIPKPMDNKSQFIYRIIDDYNILFKLVLTKEMIEFNKQKEDKLQLSIQYDVEYLDLKWRRLIIINPINEFIFEYEFENNGLITPDLKRGVLRVMLIDKDNLLEEYQGKYNEDMSTSIRYLDN